MYGTSNIIFLSFFVLFDNKDKSSTSINIVPYSIVPYSNSNIIKSNESTGIFNDHDKKIDGKYFQRDFF